MQNIIKIEGRSIRMMDKSKKDAILKTVGLAVVVFLTAYILIEMINPHNIVVRPVPHEMGKVDLEPADPTKILPDLSKYPPQVNSSTPNYIEIISSTEKAGSGTDGWLTEVARDFNSARIIIDGRPVSVRLRGIASGLGADYIAYNKYLPDAYTPSNELWGEIIVSRGAKAELVEKRLAGNVAGIVLTKSKKDELVTKYGAINATTIVEAVANKELNMGYTNPFASSTGLNFLISILQAFDSSNPLSDKAVAGFERFQANIPYVAHTTLQLRESAKSGVLDGFILEYQTYLNTPDIRSYEFIPFGVRHDSPMYAIGELSPEKKKILSQFIQFSKQEKYQALATSYGFNGFNHYKSDARAVKGDVIIQAQKLWKEKKDPIPICAVFVADVSGSMMGAPLNNLKISLREGQKNIGNSNLIGLVSYSDGVNIDLPISKFNLTQRAYFVGAVDDLQAGGSTATFEAIDVAMNMIEEQLAINPNIKPMVFVLSDGETNRGRSLNNLRQRFEKLGITINTIGYNADIPALKEISLIKEGVYIDADTEDVVYQLSSMFNTLL
jgi:Ca-activated chloride channel family protein